MTCRGSTAGAIGELDAERVRADRAREERERRRNGCLSGTWSHLTQIGGEGFRGLGFFSLVCFVVEILHWMIPVE